METTNQHSCCEPTCCGGPKSATPEPAEVRAVVREFYGRAADGGPGCCGSSASSSFDIGYTAAQLAAIPESANLGLGCGNPTAIAELTEGERVLDLGSGAGIDVFLAASAVGPEGHVIGVDMTPEMLERARSAAGEYPNVEFRLGEIERLPVADDTVDVVISNCVVNLSSDKPQVFAEVFRTLRPGVRVRISDVLALQPLPQELLDSVAAVAGCVAGAATIAETEAMLSEAGFENIEIVTDPASAEVIRGWLPGAEKYVTSATVRATKPAAR